MTAFQDGLEAAARVIDELAERMDTSQGQAMLDEIAARIRALEPPPAQALIPISSLPTDFERFKMAYLAAGGTRNPRSVKAKGWDAAEKVFNRLVTKQKHHPSAIISGTEAFAASRPETQYVWAPEVFLNGEKFLWDWSRANAAPQRGNERGAPSLFDVEQYLSDGR